MIRVIFNQKGGVGKSTIACNLAAIDARKGRRTLVVDLDPQCNSSQYLLGTGAEGVVVNQFQPRANLPRKLVQELVDEGLPVLGASLSSSVKIRESHELARPMIYLAPCHKLALEFVALHEELESRPRKARTEKASRAKSAA